MSDLLILRRESDDALIIVSPETVEARREELQERHVATDLIDTIRGARLRGPIELPGRYPVLRLSWTENNEAFELTWRVGADEVIRWDEQAREWRPEAR